MNTNELSKFWASIEEVINAPTKKEAKPLVSRLKFQASQIKANINDPYFKNKLDEVIIYAEEASGNIINKIEAVSYVKQSWYTFEIGVKTPNKNEETNNLP